MIGYHNPEVVARFSAHSGGLLMYFATIQSVNTFFVFSGLLTTIGTLAKLRQVTNRGGVSYSGLLFSRAARTTRVYEPLTFICSLQGKVHADLSGVGRGELAAAGHFGERVAMGGVHA
jgi:hypothetical protein